jgi:hypothetical protein
MFAPVGSAKKRSGFGFQCSGKREGVVKWLQGFTGDGKGSEAHAKPHAGWKRRPAACLIDRVFILLSFSGFQLMLVRKKDRGRYRESKKGEKGLSLAKKSGGTENNTVKVGLLLLRDAASWV